MYLTYPGTQRQNLPRGHKNQLLPDLHSTFPSCSFLIPLALFFKVSAAQWRLQTVRGFFNYRGIAEADPACRCSPRYQRARAAVWTVECSRLKMLNDCRRLSNAYGRSQTEPALSPTDFPISPGRRNRPGHKAAIMPPGCSSCS